MSAAAPSARTDACLAETALFALAAAVLYGLTWQAALHGTDWLWFVRWLDESGAVHPQHPGYLVAAHALRLVLGPCGVDAFGVLAVLSVLGGAAAVAGCHRVGLAVGGERGFARCFAVLALLTPAFWHFATVVELHAPFLGVAVWAGVGVARLCRGGGLRDAVVAGAWTGAATLMHATGHLLLAVVTAALLAESRGRGARWWLRNVAVVAFAHVVVWGAGFLAIRAFGHLPASVAGFVSRPDDLAAPDNPLAYLMRWWRDMDFATQVWPTVLHEWIEPYAPVSALGFAMLALPTLRRRAAWFTLVLAGYVVVSVALIHARTDERGAYLVPLLVPAWLLVMSLAGRRIWWLLAVLTLGAGMLFRGEPDRLPPDHAFGAAAHALDLQHRTRFFVADLPEMDGAQRADPAMSLLVGRKEYDDLMAVGIVPTPPMIAAWLAQKVAEAKAAGEQLVVTDRARAYLGARVPAFDEGWRVFAAQVHAESLPAACGIAGMRVP